MEYMATQPDNAFDLIIVDPPYFEVKGEFDFAWSSFDEYLKDVERWAVELARILKDSGSLLWWGHAKKIAYTQIIIDKYLNLENSLVWHKFDGQAKKGVDVFRSFPPITERLLMYSKDVYNLTQCVYLIRDYIRAEIEKAKGKIIFKDINKALGTATNGGGVASACLSLNKSEPAMLTKEMYEKLQIWLNDGEEYKYLRKEYKYLRKEYEELRKEYEELRKEYEELRRPFNNELKLTDILEFSQEGHITGKHDHPTQKPPKLSRALIRTIGRKDGRAYIPFMGSGTETIECFNFGMEVVVTEIDEKYFKAASKRIHDETRQVAMF